MLRIHPLESIQCSYISRLHALLGGSEVSRSLGRGTIPCSGSIVQNHHNLNHTPNYKTNWSKISLWINAQVVYPLVSLASKEATPFCLPVIASDPNSLSLHSRCNNLLLFKVYQAACPKCIPSTKQTLKVQCGAALGKCKRLPRHT